MLTKKVINKSRDISSSAYYNGFCLRPIAGSPLSILNNCIRPMAVNVAEMTADGNTPVPVPDGPTNSVGRVTSIEEELQAQSVSTNALGDETHSIELGAIRKFVAEKLSASLNYARNTINPLVAHILSEAEEAKKRAMMDTELSRTIVMLEIPEIYSDGLLNTLIERNGSLPKTATPVSWRLAQLLFQDMTTELFMETVKMSNPVFDEKLAAIFNEDNVHSGIIADKVMTANTSPFAHNEELFAYLFLTAVKNGNLSTIDTASLTSDEKLEISQAINYYGYMVNRKIEDFDRYVRNGYIVDTFYDKWTNTGEAIGVIGTTYRDWLEAKDGTPEAVLGFMAGGDKPTLGQTLDLVENPAKYQEKYNKLLRTNTLANRVKGNSAVNDCVRKELYKYIREEYTDSDTDRRRMLNKVDEVTKGFTFTGNMELEVFILNVTCRCLCVGMNDSLEILTCMRSYLNDNPDSEPGTAALVAASKLAAKWVVSQMELVKL